MRAEPGRMEEHLSGFREGMGQVCWVQGKGGKQKGWGVWLGSPWAGQGEGSGEGVVRTGGAGFEGPQVLPEMGLYSGRSGEPLEVREQESDMSPQG